MDHICTHNIYPHLLCNAFIPTSEETKLNEKMKKSIKKLNEKKGIKEIKWRKKKGLCANQLTVAEKKSSCDSQ